MFLKSIFRSKERQAFENITPQTLKQRIDSGESLYLVDVRTPNEYATGHIQGTRLLPLQTLQQRISEIPQDAAVVCICRSGGRSATASELLANSGFQNVINMSGGMIAWNRAKLPIKL
jgi:rhodanese-related sulfurtransferase